MSSMLLSDAMGREPLLPLESFQPVFGRSVVMGAVLGGAVAVSPLMARAQTLAPSEVPTLGTVEVRETAPDDAYQPSPRLDSPKLTAPLLDTPKSVTVIPEALIQDRGATSLQDVLRTTPGITLGAGEGGTPSGDRPFVRGYEASTDIFIDGVRDYARGSHETFNLESVEVIKGPSSAYTGRGGTGGSINLVTKRPRLARFADVSAGFGNAGQWRTTLDGNFSFSDTGAARLNLMKMGGKVPGRGGATTDRWGIAPSVAFGLGTPTRLTLQYARVHNNDMPDHGVPFFNPARPARITPPDVDRDNFYGRLSTDFRKNELETGSILFEHDFSAAAKLRNITRYAGSLNHYLMTRPSFDHCRGATSGACIAEGPDMQFTRGNRTRWRYSRALINQTDLYGTFSTGTLKHSYSAGLELGQEKIYSKAMRGAPANDLDSLYRPDPNRRYSYDLQYGPRQAGGEIKTYSLYLFDTVELGPQWQLNAGLRRDVFKVNNDQDRRRDSFWNYQLGLIYKPAANGTVYLSYGTSSNPAGENLGQGGGADGVAGSASIQDVAPERSRSWELGTKWDVLAQRLSLTAALFETRKTNARSTDPLTGDVSLSGSNRVRGLELGAMGAVTPKWSVWAAYTFLEPKILSYRSGNSVFDGKQAKFIAKQSASLWSTYKVLPELTIGGGATYTGMRYANDANTLQIPGWTRYDAMVRYDFSKKMSLQFNVNNIGNKPLYDASHVGLFATVAPGRSYFLKLDYRFD